ncbi:MAG: acyl-CoA dehydrogenase family protein, partial [Candidatus Margulisiibacteriota bacterium]
LIHPFPIQSPEDKAIGDEFIKVLEKVLVDNIDADEVDKTGKLPQKAIKALADIGCFGMKIPKEYGGLGFSVVNYNRAMAVMGSYCGSTTVWLSAHQSIGVPQPLKLFGTKEQKEAFLPRLAKGAVSAFALTEPDVGSDPANMTTTATLSADGKYYELTGKKVWITNGPAAELLIVMAQTKPMAVNGKEKKQISAFIVETSTPGFEVVHHCEFMGIRGISNGLLRFNQMKIPIENRIGEEGQGLKIALATLNTGRLTVPAAVTGMAKLCMRYNRDWMRKRIQWGQPIGKHQAIENKNAFIATNTLAMESITWLTSAFADKSNKDIRLEAAMAKYFCTERAWTIVDETLQIKGGRGYETAQSLRGRGEKPDPIERMLRDTRINRIIEGTSEIMHLFIAREAMDMHVRYIMPIMDSRNGLVKRLKALGKAFLFYGWWYPKQFVGIPKRYTTQSLSSQNQRHLRFIAKASKCLARKLFETMGRYQQKLEREQLILA